MKSVSLASQLCVSIHNPAQKPQPRAARHSHGVPDQWRPGLCRFMDLCSVLYSSICAKTLSQPARSCKRLRGNRFGSCKSLRVGSHASFVNCQLYRKCKSRLRWVFICHCAVFHLITCKRVVLVSEKILASGWSGVVGVSLSLCVYVCI